MNKESKRGGRTTEKDVIDQTKTLLDRFNGNETMYDADLVMLYQNLQFLLMKKRDEALTLFYSYNSERVVKAIEARVANKTP